MNDFLDLLAQARTQHLAGAGSVLDLLRRAAGLPDDELARRLQREGGVTALFREGEARADFTLIDGAAARELGVVPLKLPGDAAAYWGLADPWDAGRVARAVGSGIAVPNLVALTDQLLRHWLGGEVGGGSAAQGSLPSPVEDDGVVRFVDEAVAAAYECGASDIHFECARHGVTVKLRQDGVLVEFARLHEPGRAEEVISRIKVLARLDITERRIPQDGRFQARIGAVPLDLRVSIMPSVFGEDAVLRLLDQSQLRSRHEAISLETLGFEPAVIEAIRDLAERPHGMLLVTGPTGSGKTTTVYAVLSEINDGSEKIITIEDPVEYELPGVLQIPVNERKGLTFAKGLRSILRHDPDRILVGEIRDAETAQIAVQSALTGHQVFTTVHANSIHDVTGRFRHFDLDMFGFMAALNGVVVQRLVRMACPHCVAAEPPSAREARWLEQTVGPLASVPRATGCPACRMSGYRGRRVLAEVHAVDDGLRDLVTGNASPSQLRTHLAERVAESLSQQAGRWIESGITTPEEIKRVIGWQ